MQIRHLFIWHSQKHLSEAQKTEISLSQHFVQGKNTITHIYIQMTSDEVLAAPSHFQVLNAQDPYFVSVLSSLWPRSTFWG